MHVPEKLNKIVTSFWITHTREGYPVLDTFRSILERMILECAHEIAIPYMNLEENNHLEKYGLNLSLKEIISKYPKSLQFRIRIVDKNQKEYKKIQNYFSPLKAEEEKGIINKNYYSMIMYNFYLLYLASKYKMEADSDRISDLKDQIDNLIKIVNNDEARVRMIQLKGLYNLYKLKKEISSIKLIADTLNPSIEERIADLLYEAEYLEISHMRHLLGIPSYINKGILKTKKLMSNLIRKKKYKNIIQSSISSINLVSNLNIKGIIDPTLNKYLYDYSPPLTSFSNLRDELYLDWSHKYIM